MKTVARIIKKITRNDHGISADTSTVDDNTSPTHSREYLFLPHTYSLEAIKNKVREIDSNIKIEGKNPITLSSLTHKDCNLIPGYVALYKFIEAIPNLDHPESKSVEKQIIDNIDKYCFEINKVLPLKETKLKYFTNVIINQLNLYKDQGLITDKEKLEIADYVNKKVSELMAFKYLQLNINDESAFKFIKKLGSGSQGLVKLYQVKNTDLIKELQSRKLIDEGSDVLAIKALNDTLKNDKQSTKEFENECAVSVLLWKESYKLERINQNSCRYNLAVPTAEGLILSHVESEGNVADYITNLHKEMKDNGLDIAQAVQQLCVIIADTHTGLTQIHQANIIHRDIWSQNILIHKLNSGEIIARIGDFGKAIIKKEVKKPNEEIEERNSKTQIIRMPSKAMLGTISIATDIYSFKIAILEMIAKLAGINFKALVLNKFTDQLQTDNASNKGEQMDLQDEEKLIKIKDLLISWLKLRNNPLENTIISLIDILTAHHCFDWDPTQEASDITLTFAKNLNAAIHAIKNKFKDDMMLPLSNLSLDFDNNDNQINDYQIMQDASELVVVENESPTTEEEGRALNRTL